MEGGKKERNKQDKYTGQPMTFSCAHLSPFLVVYNETRITTGVL